MDRRLIGHNLRTGLPGLAGLPGQAGVMCLFLAGCGLSEHSSPKGAQEIHAPELLSSVDLHLPIETSLFSDADSEKMARAGAVLRKKCLRRFDLDYEINPPGPLTGPRTFMERRYGVTDKAEATANGYHLGDRDPRTHPPHPPKLSAEQKQVLTGHSPKKAGEGDTALRVNGVTVPPGGCYDEAKKKSVGSGKLGSSDVVRQANFQTFTASRSVPQVKQAFEAWSSCMKRKGYSYPGPLAAISDRRFQGNSPTQLERQVATADVVCKQQVNLIGTWFTVETSLQKELIARQRADFAAALKAKNVQLAKAKAVLRDQ
ncbi:hypothetical protein AB0G35_19100 [Streptomyces sp. NPDC021749]|uniref:hypothetical protein n=1 Tax=Streptomyces sp. NPDC021749 TaxID=3154905 RepID=UPI0033E93AD6